MRLFIAIEFSKDIRDYLISIQKELPNELSYVKQFHLTLKFLGDVEDDKLEEIKNKLRLINSEHFTAELSGLGVFPYEEYIKVVWVGVGPKEKIAELQQSVESSLSGMFLNDDQFHPHITLARAKFLRDREGLKKKIKEVKIEKKTFEVNNFKLIKSTLQREGPVYEVLEEFGL